MFWFVHRAHGGRAPEAKQVEDQDRQRRQHQEDQIQGLMRPRSYRIGYPDPSGGIADGGGAGGGGRAGVSGGRRRGESGDNTKISTLLAHN